MRRRGFTLFELASVLAILGALAAVTVVSLAGFVRAGQAEEVHIHLRTLAALQRAQPGGPVACAPSPPAVPAAMAVPWVGSEGFRTIGFSTGGPTRFQYSVEVPGPDGAAFVVRARGDLNGDGKTSLYELAADQAELRIVDGLE
ncbi:MAG: prepilin-type N-terminal cleavage/methylation domain-containing protein [Myxococcales bacterium]|nr:prepilin-type N-terminal cleavage/methylation domain-containing protein [Myxococcales bacterium]